MIHYLIGNAVRPQGTGTRYIVHICNDVGGWGAGFVLAISGRWFDPEIAYREWYRNGKHPRSGPFALGEVQSVSVQGKTHEDNGIWVMNMIAQTGYGSKKTQHKGADDDGPPIRYDALRKCLQKVAKAARTTQATIHMPRIGCGLAGGSWAEVSKIIEETMGGLDVYVYDVPGGTYRA